MKLDTTVKRFHSAMSGLPTIQGQVGTLTTLLQALLVDGAGFVGVSSASVTAGVGTCTTSAPHGFEVDGTTGTVIKFSGASPAGANDEWRVLSITGVNSFTFDAFGLPDGAFSGTVMVGRAPLGWTLEFSGTNKAVYRPSQGNRYYMRIQDDASVPTSSGGRWAKIRGYEAMTGIDTGTGLFPTTTQASNGLSIVKSSVIDMSTRPWWLAGNGAILYMGFAQNPTYPTEYGVAAFGTTPSIRDIDNYNTIVIGELTDTLPARAYTMNTFGTLGTYNTIQGGKFMARASTQVGSSVTIGMQGDAAFSSYMGGAGPGYPCQSNNGLLLSQISICESSLPRCKSMPGMYQQLHITRLTHLDVYPNVEDIGGRDIQVFNCSVAGVNDCGNCMIDITGPW